MATRTKQLNVSITPHFSKFIRRKVASGRYSNASEVVREALRRLEQAEMLDQQSEIVDPDDAREAVIEGLASIERGDLIEVKGEAALQEFFEDIMPAERNDLQRRRGPP